MSIWYDGIYASNNITGTECKTLCNTCCCIIGQEDIYIRQLEDQHWISHVRAGGHVWQVHTSYRIFLLSRHKAYYTVPITWQQITLLDVPSSKNDIFCIIIFQNLVSCLSRLHYRTCHSSCKIPNFIQILRQHHFFIEEVGWSERNVEYNNNILINSLVIHSMLKIAMYLLK